jgi:hypothetical protein
MNQNSEHEGSTNAVDIDADSGDPGIALLLSVKCVVDAFGSVLAPFRPGPTRLEARQLPSGAIIASRIDHFVFGVLYHGLLTLTADRRRRHGG